MKSLRALCLCLCLCMLQLGAACKTKTTTVDACGDGVVDPGEDCDSGVGATSCASLGYYRTLGVLTCTPTCAFDTSDCGGRCGDSTVQTDDGEVCDGQNLNAQTCQGRGYYGGTLACDPGCQAFDESACAAVGRCGDDLLQAGHGEVCDGADLGGQSCVTMGYHGGALACAPGCQAFDESACAAVGRCGDNLIQSAHGEVCDDTNLDGQTCTTLGYYGGALTCLPDCSELNRSDCIAAGRCGDNTVQSPHGEACDGTNLSGQTCTTLGYYGGVLACGDECAFLLDDCASAGRCGDGTIQAAHETCDGVNFGSRTCETEGFHPGALGCVDCVLDTAGCDGRCGDGVLQTSYEQCDGADLGDQSCRTQSFFTGALSCTPSCSPDTAACRNLAELAAGLNHSCAVLSDGTVRCWGYNSYGQLGDGTTTHRTTPATVTGLSTAVKISAGDNHTCALLSDGTAQCWGYNPFGQLGDNSTTNRLTPRAVGSLSGLSAVSAGDSHSCAVKSDGTIWCWGRNNYGQLGNGTTTNSLLPIQVSGITTASGVAAGSGFTCAALTDGTARCWGSNTYGQLGDGTNTQRTSPVAVSSLVFVSAVSAGATHACALTYRSGLEIRNLMCWGRNHAGQVGDGTTTDRTAPVQVSFNNDASPPFTVSCGANHTCMRATFLPGSLYSFCWGLNTYGQLGNGGTANQSTPALVRAASRIASGGSHTCAVGSNSMNTLYCWGRNYYGQLGLGTTTDSTSPALVLP